MSPKAKTPTLTKTVKVHNQKFKLKFVLTWRRALVCLLLLGVLVGVYFAIPHFVAVDVGFASPNVDVQLDANTPTLLWHTVDVGQGDCTIVQFPDNRVLMVDAGKPAAYDTIVKYLDEWKITTIDWFVISHPDDDHYGGATKLLANARYAFKNYYCSGAYEKTDKAYVNLMATYPFQVPTDGLQIQDPAATYTLTFVSPYREDWSSIKNSNDASLMMTIEYYDKLFILTGDASNATDNLFITHANALHLFDKVNSQQVILKAAHHGSSTGSSATFLAYVLNTANKANNFVIISCGKNNKYGHPHQATLDRLAPYCEQEHIYNTATIGPIVVQATADALIVNSVHYVMQGWSYTTIFVTVGVVVIALCCLQRIKPVQKSTKN